jgi:hypothetical protein
LTSSAALIRPPRPGSTVDDRAGTKGAPPVDHALFPSALSGDTLVFVRVLVLSVIVLGGCPRGALPDVADDLDSSLGDGPLSDGSGEATVDADLVLRGACILRGNVDMPSAAAPDVGPGYARQQVYGDRYRPMLLEEIDAVCTAEVYQELLSLYCGSGQRHEVQAEVIRYTRWGTEGTCASSMGCEERHCP